jgi:hypothetical protein
MTAEHPEAAVDTPVLWHLEISHYNEKVRWALDYKGVAHVRRAVTPGLQELTARRLRAGRTTPVLELNGRAIGDSTRIIEEIERRWPEPPLYPADPEERSRALDLEDYFDEECGPDLRRVVFSCCRCSRSSWVARVDTRPSLISLPDPMPTRWGSTRPGLITPTLRGWVRLRISSFWVWLRAGGGSRLDMQVLACL